MPFDDCDGVFFRGLPLPHALAAPDEIKPRPPKRLKKLDEDVILDRLQQFQDCVEMPDDVLVCLLGLLCPDSMYEPPLPPVATDALPGTMDRLRVMASRAEAGYQLFHPDDSTWEDDDADRVGIMGCRLRNGAVKRLDQPMVRQGAEGLVQVEGQSLREGFYVPSECAVVVGKLPAPKRRKKKEPAALEATSAPQARQLLLWGDAQ